MIFEKQVVGAFKSTMYTRRDDEGTAYYFSAKDFVGLFKIPYAFKSSLGHTLQGYIYSYQNAKPGRLIVFEHGFGAGHESYMKEIEMLCRHGYRVLAYDHTGCMESGGEGCRGMAQSLHDLDDCIKAIKSDTSFSGIDISVVGHSWGGFSTLNISALHPEIRRIVVLSGFVSVPLLVSTFFPGIMKPYQKAILALEKETNPRFFDFDAVKSLSASNTKALLIYSENDAMCTRVHYDTLLEGLAHKENVQFMLLENKGHNPNYTEDAVLYLGEYLKEKKRRLRKKSLASEAQRAAFVASFDWNRMTAQDEAVWEKILQFLA
jgi:pimeloyl-ACP methyl ester carboxylesterase